MADGHVGVGVADCVGVDDFAGAGVFPRNPVNDVLASKVLTSPCRSSVLNLGYSPTRVAVTKWVAGAGIRTGPAGPVQQHDRVRERRKGRKGRKPKVRSNRKRVPSQLQVLDVLRKCLPGDLRAGFDKFFSTCIKDEARCAKHGEPTICYTPIRWITGGLGVVLGLSDGDGPRFLVQQLVSLRDIDVFHPSGFVSTFQQEFILMDVVLNRTFTPIDAVPAVRGGAVIPVRSRDVDRLAPEADGEFRTVIAVIPSVGYFYVARERRQASTVEEERKSMVPHDMSWLRLTRDGEFGEGGYVRCLYDARVGSISAWRVSLNLSIGSLPTRLMRTASQLSDEHGPALPPDVFDGDHPDWSPDDRAVLFNTRLAESNAARLGGGHYARGCHHFRMPSTCCVVDPTVTPVVDFIVELADSCSLKSRKTAILIRNVLSSPDNGTNVVLNGALDQINIHNELVARACPVGGARHSRRDLGAMHPIGTRIHLGRVGVSAYAVNSVVPEPVLREFVRSLSIVGRHCFPDVLTMIQELESDSGITPVPPMDGDGQFGRVGSSIDMSVDLVNASHYDVGDASPGFSVWTERIPGAAGNWYFVMPNVVGVDEAGHKFHGLAVKLTHGVAISWDGRVLRHCTSLCEPNANANANSAQNLLFGSFSAAKFSVLEAGTMR